MVKVEDHLGRKFEKLRVSLLNSCNFSCEYCTAESIGVEYPSEQHLVNKEEILPVHEILKLILAVHEINPLRSIRLTGGEPLLYPHLAHLIEQLNKAGIEDLRLTTNGYYLAERIEKLKMAGLKSINISIDAIQPETLHKISRNSNAEKVFEGIDAAIESGLNVKLNAVIMRGRNEKEILPLLEFAAEKGVKIRYLELMKMGHLYHVQNPFFFSEKEILQTINTRYEVQELPRKDKETARYWSADGNRIFGIIANESTPFCHDCNRLRMDSRGVFYGCLSNSNGMALQPFINSKPNLSTQLKKLLLLKQPVRFKGSELSMRNIGG